MSRFVLKKILENLVLIEKSLNFILKKLRIIVNIWDEFEKEKKKVDFIFLISRLLFRRKPIGFGSLSMPSLVCRAVTGLFVIWYLGFFKFSLYFFTNHYRKRIKLNFYKFV